MTWTEVGGQELIGYIRIPVPAVHSASGLPVRKDWYAVQSPDGLPVKSASGHICSIELLVLLRQHPSARSSVSRLGVRSAQRGQAKTILASEASRVPPLALEVATKEVPTFLTTIEAEEVADEAEYDDDVFTPLSSKPLTPDLPLSPIEDQRGGHFGREDVEDALTMADLRSNRGAR